MMEGLYITVNESDGEVSNYWRGLVGNFNI